jgi:hypothetical protein
LERGKAVGAYDKPRAKTRLQVLTHSLLHSRGFLKGNEELGDAEKISDGLHTDISPEIYREVLLMYLTEREAIAKRVETKLDCILLPMVVTPFHQTIHVLTYF